MDAFEAAMIPIKRGNFDELRQIVDKAPEVVNRADEYGVTLLMQAAKYGRLDAVSFLIEEKGADPCRKDNSGRTALDYAKGDERMETVLTRLISEQGKASRAFAKPPATTNISDIKPSGWQNNAQRRTHFPK